MAKWKIYCCPVCKHKFKNFKWCKVLFSVDIDEEACCPQCHTPARNWPHDSDLKGK